MSLEVLLCGEAVATAIKRQKSVDKECIFPVEGGDPASSFYQAR